MSKKLFVFIVFVCIFSFIPFSVSHAAVTWSETRPAGDQTRGWSTASLSSDGQKMIVGNQDGGLFISTNGGSSWTQISPSGFDTDTWYISSMSPDGRVILAGVYGGYLYLSRNGGDSWSEAQPAGHTGLNWTNTSISSNGQVILVSSDSGRLYKTVDGGSTWSEVRPLGDQDLTWHTAVSANGKIIFASEDNGSGGRLYISTDTGSSWTETRPLDNAVHGWGSVSMSADGKILLVLLSADKIYISRDSGSSWTASDIVGQWIRSSMSPDGQTMFASDTQRLYFSSDTGNTWIETQPAGDQDKDWELLSLSANSRSLIAGSYNGRIYMGANPALKTSEKASPLQCTVMPKGPDLFQINTTKNTATLYFSPVGNASNYKISYGLTTDANEFSTMTGLGSSTGVLSYTVNNLPGDTPVYFKIYAQNDCANGTWSNSMSVKTDGKVYYKNLLSRVLSVLPKQTTTLTSQSVSGASTCSTYAVVPGDTLWKIASKNLGSGVKFGNIMQSNGLKSSLLHIGQKLKVGC